MKERPILFSAPMVQAILEGRKTQTRRIVKDIPENVSLHTYYGAYTDGRLGSAPRSALAHSLGWFVPVAGDLWPCNDKDRIRCPYGQPGDRLWVRETHIRTDLDFSVHYRADEDFPEGAAKMLGGWHPSIFMPRKFSRILLEITGIRVELLQDISEADAIAEGIHYANTGLNRFGQKNNGWSWKRPHPNDGDRCLGSARFAYGNLWESINGAGSWDANPYVWVYEFRRIES